MTYLDFQSTHNAASTYERYNYMARKAASKSVTPATSANAVALVDQDLAAEAAALRNQISAPAGNKIRVERTGAFTLPDGTDLGDEFQAVVIDFYSRNMFYSSPYDANNITPPDCYAVGKDKSTLAPNDDSPAKQADSCATCPMNAFKSGAGKAKACQNRYWVGLVIVDPDDPEAHVSAEAPLYVLDLSPSNLRSFEAFVAGVGRTLNGPPIKAIVTVKAKNVGTYAAVTFSNALPNPDYAQQVQRRPEATDVLTRTPDFSSMAALNGPKSRAPARRQAGNRR